MTFLSKNLNWLLQIDRFLLKGDCLFTVYPKMTYIDPF